MIRRVGIALGGVLVLGALAASIAQKEAVLASGTPVLLKLRPVDPRSLMEGDYMALRYALADQLGYTGGDDTPPDRPTEGLIWVVRGEHDVARLATSPAEPGALPLRYRVRDGFARLGPDAFYFEEGTDEKYARAAYGELRVDAAGDSVLVALRDDEFDVLGTALTP